MADAPKARIATIKGIWVRPGVSKNRRLYTKEHIAAAVAEGQQRIASGSGPLTILTHHGARDGHDGDVTRTVGHVTKLGLDADGNGTFEADVADTQAGREVAALALGGHVKGVSMAGTWIGEPRTVQTADGPAETADGFSLRGIDFTHSPGVTGAGLTSAEMAEGVLAGSICEELEEVAFVDEPSGTTEASDAANTQGSTYADPGYQKDKKKRYPLTSAKRVRAAWSYINQEKNAKKYSAAQLKRVKGRIQKAAKKFGIDIQAETDFLVGELTELLEAYASMSVDNGPATVRVAAFVNEPADLAATAKRIALATLAGLHALDPDNDGDIDTGDGEGDTSTDTDMEAAPCIVCGADVPDGAKYCPACGQAVPTAESAPGSAPSNEGDTVGETTNTPAGSATESTPITLTQEQLDALVAKSTAAALEAAGVKPAVEESEELKAARKLIAEAEAAKASANGTPAPGATAPATPAAPVETAPVGVVTLEQVQALIAESNAKAAEAAVEKFRAEHVKELRAGPVKRIGLVAESQTAEELYGDGGGEALRKATTAELNKVADDVMFPLIAAGR